MKRLLRILALLALTISAFAVGPRPAGVYIFAMSSTNLVDEESGMSNEAVWDQIHKPVITGIAAP